MSRARCLVYVASSPRNAEADDLLRRLRSEGFDARRLESTAPRDVPRALRGSFALVLALPCGRGSHVALGMALAYRVPTYVVAAEGVAEEALYDLTDGVLADADEAVGALAYLARN